MTHVYPLPPRALQEAMLHPAMDAFLSGRLPDLEKRTLLELTRSGDHVVRRVRCVPVARIPEAAQAVVKPEMITWVEEAHVDLVRGHADIRIALNGFQDVFSFRGEMSFLPHRLGCERHARGELGIRMFMVGRLVEEFLGGLVEKNMHAEAQALAVFVGEGRHLS